MGTVSKICHQEKNTKCTGYSSAVLVLASAIELEDIANVRKGSEGTDVSNHRKPKLFFVSTTSTTSTLKTATACYFTSGNAVTTCSRRRRRAFVSEGVEDIPEFQPSQVESGMYDDDTASEGRQGKFLLYWLTTTTTSITTEFTKTTTVYSVICTPSGASECG